MQLVILFDFAGVLDIKDSYKVNNHDLHWRTCDQVDIDKARMLLTFISETDADYGCISTLEQYDANVMVALLRTLRHKGTDEDKALVEKFRGRNRIDKEVHVDVSDGKNKGIEKFASRNPDAQIIVFEDEEFIDEKFGLVRVSGHSRLQESDIEKARSMIDK
ncbi:hypothetical protein [Vibrio harveyi]|uniref:hypothetical protein n=1 Tax=Vibrio harveyi TaxID=669 RepID=UPI003CEB4ED4